MPIPNTVQVTGPLAPSETTDTYPTHISQYGKGGHHEVADAAARNAITTFRRVAGMLATTQDDGKTWRLLAEPWNYNDADWVELTGSASSEYTNTDPTTIAVGGIPAGSTFPSGTTVADVITELLYPYQNPAFSSFALTGQGPSVEVGYTIPASVVFTWGTSQSANVQPNTVALSDVTGSLSLATGLANDGSEAVTMPASVQKVTATSHTFRVAAQNTQSGNFQRDYAVTWFWSRYHGTDISATLTSGSIAALASSGLASGYAGTYNFAAGGYKFICFAHAAGGQINRVTYAGFDVAMVTNDGDPGNATYSNVDGGGFHYALVSHTNAQGVTTNYRIYRTLYVLGGSTDFTVT